MPGHCAGTGNTQYPLRVNTAGIWSAVLLGGLFSIFIPNNLTIIWSSFILTAPVTAYLHRRRFSSLDDRF